RRGGRKCPGYQSRLKFVNESVKPRGQARRRKSLSSTGAVWELSSMSIYGETLPHHISFPAEHNAVQKGIVASFVQDLFPLGQLTAQHSFIGSWLWHVPEVLHENYAMDIAVESLALAYFAKKAGSTEMLIRSHNAYANALVSLSGALQDHRLRLTSETLCATLLLVHFEARESHCKSWITYAGGAGRLIQLRGPDRHRSGFDSTMLMASRGYLVCLP
ncbi:hypothetical protein BGW36DRAFT_270695, partial [Talaromyces proteolyticus]